MHSTAYKLPSELADLMSWHHDPVQMKQKMPSVVYVPYSCSSGQSSDQYTRSPLQGATAQKK